jgi:hypothetical protein
MHTRTVLCTCMCIVTYAAYVDALEPLTAVRILGTMRCPNLRVLRHQRVRCRQILGYQPKCLQIFGVIHRGGVKRVLRLSHQRVVYAGVMLAHASEEDRPLWIAIILDILLDYISDVIF